MKSALRITWRCLLVVLILLAILFWYLYVPKSSTPYRVHPALGVVIYDTSKEDTDEEIWKWWLDAVYWSHRAIQRCLGSERENVDKNLTRIKVVIIPSSRILAMEERTGGFAILNYLFIRRGQYTRLITHEWIHAYLYVSGKRSLDLFHRDPLFAKCEYVGE